MARAARQRTIARRQEARGLSPRAFPREAPYPRVKAQLLRGLELPGSPDDLPEHVDAENERRAEPAEREPAQVMHAREQRRGDQQCRDDERAADAVRDGAHHVLEVAEVGRCDADLEGPGLELVPELTDASRHAAERLELRVEPREQLIRLEAPLPLAQHHLERVLLEQL